MTSLLREGQCSEQLLWHSAGYQCQMLKGHGSTHRGYWASPFGSEDGSGRLEQLLGAWVEWTTKSETKPSGQSTQNRESS
jgi:hypothetical protein